MQHLIAALLGALSLVIVPGIADAEDIADKAKAAETFAAAGNFVAAMDALDEAASALWDKSPLVFRRALWVAEAPTGFGAYIPREANVFGSGHEMHLYTEPVGFGWRKSGDIWRTELVIDVLVKTAAGEQIFQQSDFQKLLLGSRVRNREFMAHVTYTLTGIPPGDYVIDTTFRDAVTGKSGTVSLPFVIQ
jgi:hypothetical protein